MAYDEGLGFECMQALWRAFPEEVTFEALLKSCSVKAADAEWLTVLDALEQRRLVSGAFIRSGHPYTLKAVYSVRLTDAGVQYIQQEGISNIEQLEQIADLTFEQTRHSLYEELLREEIAQIQAECAVHGVVRSSVFVRRVADAVYRRLETLKTAFADSYIKELENTQTGISAFYEYWLQRKLEQTWEPELIRARGVAMLLAQGTGLQARDVAGIVEQVEIRGRLELKKQLSDQIRIAKLRRTQRDRDYNVDMAGNREPMSQSGVTNIYNLHGSHARVNIESTDASVNVSNVTPQELFAALRAEIQKSSVEHGELLTRLDALEASVGTPSFGERYQQFIAAAANHMTVLGPFLPALARQRDQGIQSSGWGTDEACKEGQEGAACAWGRALGMTSGRPFTRTRGKR